MYKVKNKLGSAVLTGRFSLITRERKAFTRYLIIITYLLADRLSYIVATSKWVLVIGYEK